jgi:hypothetical protein
MMEVAQSLTNSHTRDISENDKREIRNLFMEVLDTKDLSSMDVKQLHGALQPDSLLERFAARKENKIGPNKDFISLKGQKN